VDRTFRHSIPPDVEKVCFSSLACSDKTIQVVAICLPEFQGDFGALAESSDGRLGLSFDDARVLDGRYSREEWESPIVEVFPVLGSFGAFPYLTYGTSPTG
jgi:hypothetical protein